MAVALPPPPPDADPIDRIDYWRTLKNAAAAAEADAILAFARAHVESQIAAGNVEPEQLERSIAAQVGLACRVSPTEGRKRVRIARDLHDGHSRIHEMFTAGLLSEYQVATITRATAHLSGYERAQVDEQLATRRVERLGVRRMGDLARKLAAEVAPEKFTARARAARTGRYVSLRPGEDGMAYLTAHLPAEQAIACLGSLAKAVQQAAVDPSPQIRGRGQIMADTLVERLTGQPCADTVPVEVQVLVPVEALLDPTSPLPGEIPGHGPIPLERILPHATAMRRLLTRDGIVIGGDSRQRTFTGVLAELIRARDGGRCREPYCDAPIREIDHIRRHTDGGPTTFDNGRGLCAFHNQVRETPGWHAEYDNGVVVTTTPTGHTYASDARNGTAQGSVESSPLRPRPRWKDQHRARAVPDRVPARRDRGRPGRPQLRDLRVLPRPVAP